MVDMAHFAGLVAGKVFTGEEDPVPYAHVTTTTTHKSLRGPRGGLVLATEEYADSVDRGCPMVLGGPLSHVMAAKAVALAEARQPSFQTYAQQHRRQRQVAGRRLPLPRRHAGHRRHRQPHRAARRVVLRAHRPAGRVGAARRRRGHQPQLGARPTPTAPGTPPASASARPALTTRGFGHDEFDRVAELVVDVLKNTEPGTTKAGAPSKATYVLADGVADRTKAASAELLDKHPLYPGLELS